MASAFAWRARCADVGAAAGMCARRKRRSAPSPQPMRRRTGEKPKQAAGVIN